MLLKSSQNGLLFIKDTDYFSSRLLLVPVVKGDLLVYHLVQIVDSFLYAYSDVDVRVGLCSLVYRKSNQILKSLEFLLVILSDVFEVVFVH